MKPNSDIRNLIRVSGFCSWQVAEKLGMHENSLYRMLRKELDDQDKKRIYQVLEQLKVERDAELTKINSAERVPK
ncbi:DNA-binding phage protein [Bradyrhizobium japonicum]